MKFQDLISFLVLHEAATPGDPPDEIRLGAETPNVNSDDDVIRLGAETSSADVSKKETTNKDKPKVTHSISAEGPNSKRVLSMALLVAMADTKAGASLKKLLTYYGDLYFNYSNSKKEALSCRDRYDKLPNKDSDLAVYLLQRAKEYESSAAEVKQQMINDTPEIVRRLHKIIKVGSTNFVSVLQNSPEYSIKSFDELEDKILTPEKETVLEFLQDIYQGKEQFEPLRKFVDVQLAEDRDPIYNLITIYKSLLSMAMNKYLVGSPKRVFDHIVGSRIVRTIVEPTKGKKELAKRDPELIKVIFYVRKGKFDRAKEAVLQSGLRDSDKADVMINIDKFSKGEITEADLVRPLFNM